jgi:hypothetical protein
MKQVNKNIQIKKEARNTINNYNVNNGATIMKIIDPDFSRKYNFVFNFILKK